MSQLKYIYKMFVAYLYRIYPTVEQQSLIEQTLTLVIVSHDLVNAIAISDTVYVLSKEPGKDGGTIVKTIDLIERDLAWHSDIKQMPAFLETVKEVKSLL